ncbi:MAG: hypothetical protein ABIK62_07790 [candidate division WOR-3 bacterium]
MSIAHILFSWQTIGALLTFFIFSFLFRDNPFYKFAEHLFVGVSLGYTIVLTWYSTVLPDLVQPLFFRSIAEVPIGQKLLLIVPLAFGMLYFAAFVPKVGWLMRIPMGFIMGWGMGVWIPATVQTTLLKQIQGSLLTPTMLTKWHLLLFGLISLVGVVCSVIYFFFSREQKGALKIASETGIIFLMIGFGASFGYTVMARMSLLIGRFQFLLRDWLGVIH